ncbi:MAG: efflux RND transporter periplasmic adaptor subunit [Rhodospirillales bacterium]
MTFELPPGAERPLGSPKASFDGAPAAGGFLRRLRERLGDVSAPKTGRGRLLVGALLAIGVAVVLVWGTKGKGGTISYRTAEVARRPIASVVSASGTLRPEIQVLVVAQAPGQVTDVLAGYDSRVKAGDVLARLNSAMAEARVQGATADLDAARTAMQIAHGQTARALLDVDAARANVVSGKADVDRAGLTVGDATTDLQRKQELARTGDAAKVETERAKSAYSQAGAGLTSAKARQSALVAAVASAEAAAAVAQAQEKNAEASVVSHEAVLRQWQIDLDQTYIRAPIDGIVTDRNVVVGQTVAAGAGAPAMFAVANDLHRLDVHASIDEADIGRVSVGQEAVFSFDAFPGQQFAGKVVEIHKTPQIAQNLVSYDVVLDVANDELKLLPGMTANVAIIAARRDSALVVPNAALRFRPPGAGAGAGAGAAAPAEAIPADASQAAGEPGTVWVFGSHDQPKAVAVRTGISDGTQTEITAGNLTEGEKVLVGVKAAGETASVGPLKF